MADLDIPLVSTWEIADADGGARRPAIEDVGGALLENEPADDDAPDKSGAMIFDDMANQWEYQMLAAGRMIPSCKLTIGFSAGAPFVDKIESGRRGTTAGDFVLTDGGTGITQIEWLTTLLPPIITEPIVTMSDSTTGAPGIQVEIIGADSTHTAIQVTTWDGGAKADKRFTVWI